MVEIADVDRKIRLAKRKMQLLEGHGHIEHVVRTLDESLLEILEDISKILEQQERAIRAMPRSS